MIVEDYKITVRNVASKLYRFIPEEIELAFNDFEKLLCSHGYHPDGRMFFAILSDPTEEVMMAELFLTIEESYFKINEDEEINYHSYFCVDNMIMTRITEDFDEKSQVKYWELIDYLRNNNMIQITPIFVEYKISPSGRMYVEMSVGTA